MLQSYVQLYQHCSYSMAKLTLHFRRWNSFMYNNKVFAYLFTPSWETSNFYQIMITWCTLIMRHSPSLTSGLIFYPHLFFGAALCTHYSTISSVRTSLIFINQVFQTPRTCDCQKKTHVCIWDRHKTTLLCILVNNSISCLETVKFSEFLAVRCKMT